MPTTDRKVRSTKTKEEDTYMAINWNDYELVLEEESSKECEVTGRDMGGIATYTCPVGELLNKEGSPKWTPEGYGGYQAYRFFFERADDEKLYMRAEKNYTERFELKPGDKWSSSWYSFGTWSYCVRLKLRKIESSIH